MLTIDRANQSQIGKQSAFSAPLSRSRLGSSNLSFPATRQDVQALRAPARGGGKNQKIKEWALPSSHGAPSPRRRRCCSRSSAGPRTSRPTPAPRSRPRSLTPSSGSPPPSPRSPTPSATTWPRPQQRPSREAGRTASEEGQEGQEEGAARSRWCCRRTARRGSARAPRTPCSPRLCTLPRTFLPCLRASLGPKRNRNWRKRERDRRKQGKDLGGEGEGRPSRLLCRCCSPTARARAARGTASSSASIIPTRRGRAHYPRCASLCLSTSRSTRR